MLGWSLRVLECVIDRRQVEAHLPCVLRFELAALQVDDHEAPKFSFESVLGEG